MASRPPRTICTAWLPVSAPSARVNVLGVQRVPQPLGAAPGQRVLLLDGAAQPDDVLGGVAALDAGPARVVGPLLAQQCGLVRDPGRRAPSRWRWWWDPTWRSSLAVLSDCVRGALLVSVVTAALLADLATMCSRTAVLNDRNQ